MRMRWSLLGTLLVLSAGAVLAAGSGAAELPLTGEFGESDRLKPLLDHFARHGIQLEYRERLQDQVVEWFVLQPRTQDIEVYTSFRLFSLDATPERMRERMSSYNLGSVVNDGAHVAMFIPSARCTTPGVDCSAALEKVEAVQKQMLDLFQRYVPPAKPAP